MGACSSSPATVASNEPPSNSNSNKKGNNSSNGGGIRPVGTAETLNTWSTRTPSPTAAEKKKTPSPTNNANTKNGGQHNRIPSSAENSIGSNFDSSNDETNSNQSSSDDNFEGGGGIMSSSKKNAKNNHNGGFGSPPNLGGTDNLSSSHRRRKSRQLDHSDSRVGLHEIISGDLKNPNLVRIEVPLGKPIEEVYEGVHDGPVLGSGISGIVRLVKHRKTQVSYAVKCLDLALIDSDEGLKQLKEEIYIMCQLVSNICNVVYPSCCVQERKRGEDTNCCLHFSSFFIWKKRGEYFA